MVAHGGGTWSSTWDDIKGSVPSIGMAVVAHDGDAWDGIKGSIHWDGYGGTWW